MSNEVSKALKEEILMSSKKKINLISSSDIEKADEFCEPYKDFLNKSRTEREAVAEAVLMAKENGFKEYNPNKTYNPGDKVYIVNRNKAVGFAVIGKYGTRKGVMLSIAHIDSPRIDLKPNPLYEKDNMALFKTHYYGGIKKYQWT
ncbi:MAG: aminopeptidase, partial [Oscillospiraceae bacterium]|nr:aminopeptidase [Oscillospiraceae bacterium]